MPAESSDQGPNIEVSEFQRTYIWCWATLSGQNTGFFKE